MDNYTIYKKVKQIKSEIYLKEKEIQLLEQSGDYMDYIRWEKAYESQEIAKKYEQKIRYIKSLSEQDKKELSAAIHKANPWFGFIYHKDFAIYSNDLL